MPRGGARIGAGRKPNPESASAKARAARNAKALAAQLTQDGVKKPDTPANWPFGTRPESEAPVVVQTEVLAPAVVVEEGLSALTYFQRLYRDPKIDDKVRFMAAVQALPFEVAKPGVTGKKAAKDDAAKKAVSRFAPSAPPRLAAVNGGKV